MKKLAVLFTILILASCSVVKDTWNNANLFPVSEDIKLGGQVYTEIMSNKAEYPTVPEAGNEELYSYVRGITKKIINNGNVRYATEFHGKSP
jgi:hypothetical protein